MSEVPAGAISGRRVALAESRELDLLADMLARAGADVLRCPMVAIHDAPDPAPIDAWIDRAVSDALDDVVFYTGEGVRRLAGFAERAGKASRLVTALGRIRKITRGPKPVRALRELGLTPDITAQAPTTDGIIATLDHHDLAGRRIGVQLYGETPNDRLLAYLEGRGAVVDTVAPYRYAADSEDRQVEELIRALADGAVDVIAFTSSPQVTRLGRVAERTGLTGALADGLARTRIAAVGPVVAETLIRFGTPPDAIASTPFSLKPLVNTVTGLFADAAG